MGLLLTAVVMGLLLTAVGAYFYHKTPAHPKPRLLSDYEVRRLEIECGIGPYAERATRPAAPRYVDIEQMMADFDLDNEDT